MLEFNARCDPPWSEKELEHKLDDAAKLARHSKPRGHLLGRTWSGGAPQAKPSAVTVFDVDTSEPLPGEKRQPQPTADATPLPSPQPQGASRFSPNDELKDAWVASQLKVFFAEGLIPAREDGSPDMDVATELAGWLKLSHEAYETRGIEAPDEEIRRTALACQFEHRGGRLPTMRAALGFLSVRLLALRPVEPYVEGGDCGPALTGYEAIGGASPATGCLAVPEGGDDGQAIRTDSRANGGVNFGQPAPAPESVRLAGAFRSSPWTHAPLRWIWRHIQWPLGR